MIKLNLTHSQLSQQAIEECQERVTSIHHMIHNQTGLGHEFLGWVDLPQNYDHTEYNRLKLSAQNLASQVDTLVVVGIGGSYLGARAAIEMINGLYNHDAKEVIYFGNTMSSTYTAQVLKALQNKRFGICVVSKSGTTTEPAIGFRLLKELLEQKVGVEASKKLIVAVTDAKRGALKQLANQEGYETFIIPDNIGGRYSVLTPVGMYAMAFAGVDTDAVWRGAQQAMCDTAESQLANNAAYRYAVARYLLNTQKHYRAELFVSYELQLQMIGEWWKQLFGESEGKMGHGLFPASCIFSTDLHSLGQFIQDGTKGLLFETVIRIAQPPVDVAIKPEAADLDGLNYLTNKSLHEINSIAFDGVLEAHVTTGQVPNLVLEFATMDAQMFGYLAYWFMKACAMSAYLLDINPFDQPGVEIYKQNMFKLLKKPGY